MNTGKKNTSGAELELHDLEKRLNDAGETGVAGTVEPEKNLSGTDTVKKTEPDFEFESLDDNGLSQVEEPYPGENSDIVFSDASDAPDEPDVLDSATDSEDHESVPGEENLIAEPVDISTPGGTFACESLPEYRDFVFESREGRFLFSGPEVQTLEEQEQIRSYCQVVTDFYDSPGPGVMIVDGNHKYASVLARRTLQRRGEITDEFVLHPMQNLKVGKNQSALFYQLVPRPDQTRLHQESEKAPEGFLLHDTVGLLAGLLRTMKRDGPVALALHLPEAVLVVAGDYKRVVWARRYVLAGGDVAALRDGFDVIAQDIQTASRDAGMDIREVRWIESLTREVHWPEYSSEEVHFTRLPVFGVQRGEDSLYSSLPGIIDSVPRSTSLSEPAERVMVSVGRWEKWILASVCFLAVIIAGSGVWMHQHLDGLDHQIRQLSSDKSMLQGEYASLVASIGFTREESMQAADASKAAAMVQRVDQSVPLAAVWNGLAMLRPASCRIQALELTYESNVGTLRLEGVIDLGLTQAQAVYGAFLTALEQGGFVIKQQHFQLDVDSNFFSMVLEKPFAE
ncbi:MAG: hypothetical protein PHO79_03675 [Desulfoplanes sp.]|nr:hypothetical protein [Desulfoplanes sp.]MDD4649102.1 hypothetical protein [Desulfoplanes sp.]